MTAVNASSESTVATVVETERTINIEQRRKELEAYRAEMDRYLAKLERDSLRERLAKETVEIQCPVSGFTTVKHLNA